MSRSKRPGPLYICRLIIINMEQEPLSGTESLQIIQEMIQKARNQFSENGHLYLFWGWVILICSIGQFVLQHILHTPHYYYIWGLTWVAAIYQFYYLFKRRKNEKVKTYADSIVGYVWLAFIVTMFLSFLAIGSTNDVGHFYRMYAPILLALYGIPTFLSGIILKVKSLAVGGVCCWLLSVISNWVSPDYHMILLGLAVIIAWIVPGYFLKKRYKEQH